MLIFYIIIALIAIAFVVSNLKILLILAFFVSLVMWGIGGTSFWTPLFWLILSLFAPDPEGGSSYSCSCGGNCPNCGEPRRY